MRAAALLLVAAATAEGCSFAPCGAGCTAEFFVEPMTTEMTVNCSADVVRVTPPTNSCGGVGAYGHPVVREGGCRAAVSFLDGEVSLQCTQPGRCVFTIEMALQQRRCVCPDAPAPPADACALGACSEGKQSCRALPNGTAECSQCTMTCLALPTCGEHEHMSDFPCSQRQVLNGECRVAEQCCRRTYCRLQRTYDACATKPCAATEQCRPTPRTCLDPEAACEQYSCEPKPDACCKALPVCRAALPEPRHACTTSEMISGTCERRAVCCEETFCGVGGAATKEPQPSPCASVRCGEKKACVVETRQCAAPPCTQTRCAELCCDVPPVCPAGYAEAVDICSPDDFASGACVRRRSCCVERTCRRVPGSCDAPDACPPHARCVPQPHEGVDAHSCEALPTCTLHACASDEVCFDECDAFGCSARCRARPQSCCMALPSCAAGEDGTGIRCTPREVAAKTCRRAAMCCNELFCRPLPQQAGGASSDATVPTWAWVVLAAGISGTVVAVTATVWLCCLRCRRAQCGAQQPSRPSTAGTLSPRKLSVVSLEELHCVREVVGSPTKDSAADNADDGPAIRVSNMQAKE